MKIFTTNHFRRINFLLREFIFRSRQKGSNGQAMPFFLAMIVTLIICWAMMLNIAKLLLDRMVLQNAADNAVMSVAVCKARLLNRLGQLNYLIACALYGTEEGIVNYCTFGLAGGTYARCSQVGPGDFEVFPWNDTQQRVACIADCASHGVCSGVDYGLNSSDRFVGYIRNLVKTLIPPKV